MVQRLASLRAPTQLSPLEKHVTRDSDRFEKMPRFERTPFDTDPADTD